MAGCEELQPAEEETTGYQQLSSHEQFQSVKNHLFSLNACVEAQIGVELQSR